MKSCELEKKLTLAVALGREELRLVAAIFLSSARAQHFVCVRGREDSIRLRMRAVHESELWGRWRLDRSDNTLGWAEFVTRQSSTVSP